MDNKMNILLEKITSSENLEDQFKRVFGSDDARKDKGVVYFFMSGTPVLRVKGESNILYIGKTKNTLRSRYLQHAGKLSSGLSGEFYKNIIDNYGGISIGYLTSSTPAEDEAKHFKEYHSTHLEFPPKSKVRSRIK